MNEEQNIERFDAFLKGEMNSSQKKAFLHDLNTNEELKHAFEEHKLLYESFKRKGREAMLAQVAAAHEGMGNVNTDAYKSHNSSAWKSFFKNLFAFGIIGAVTLFGIKYWEDIRQLDEKLEKNSMQFGEPKEKTVRIFVDTIKTQEVAYDTVYKEIRVSGSQAEIEEQIKMELERFQEENPDSEIEIREDSEGN